MKIAEKMATLREEEIKKDERKSPTNAGAPETEKGKASNNRGIDGRKGRRKEAH